MKQITFKPFTREQILEAKRWYLEQNKLESPGKREKQSSVIEAFDYYPGRTDFDDQTIREKFLRVQAKIERYFTLKEKGRT